MKSRDKVPATPAVDEQFLTRFKAAPNLRRLAFEEVGPYLDGLKARLGELYRILLTANDVGFHTAGDHLVDTRPEAGYFVGKLMAFVDCLRLKLKVHEFEESPLTLSIDPTGSGFPHLRDVWFYNEDHARARQQLSQLDHDAIVAAARQRILSGEQPRREQALKARHDYYHLLLLSHHLRDFYLEDPVQLKQRPGQRLYRLDGYTVDGRYNVFIFFSLVFILEGKPHLHGPWSSARRTHPAAPLIEARVREAALQPLGTLARHLDSVPGLQPKLLERYTFGPYHHEFTEEQGATRALLDEHGGTLFRFHTETLVSRGVRSEASLMKRVWAELQGNSTTREMFGTPERANFLITPFHLKQVLKSNDEFGVPCTVFGVTRQGDILA